MNILDGVNLNASDTKVREVTESKGFEQQGIVSVSEGDKYLEFDSSLVTKRLKPYLQKKAVSRDIITKSLYVKVKGQEVEFLSTDAISFISSKMVVVNHNFPKEAVIDTESFAVVAKTHNVKTHLISREYKFFSKFYGGEIFIPSYKLNTKVYKAEFGEVLSSGEINTLEFRAALSSLYPIVFSSDLPELGYIFFEEDYAYASNGVVVSKVKCNSPRCVIRLSDVNLLLDMFESIEDPIFNMEESKSYYRIRSETFSYTFPKVDVELSQSYKNLFEKLEGVYYVNHSYFASILEVLSRLPDFSGVVQIKSGEGKMKGIAKTKKGDVSDFNISTSHEGVVNEGFFGMSVKALKVALKVFKGEASISSAFMNNKLIYDSGNKQCIIVLKK